DRACGRRRTARSLAPRASPREGEQCRERIGGGARRRGQSTDRGAEVAVSRDERVERVEVGEVDEVPEQARVVRRDDILRPAEPTTRERRGRGLRERRAHALANGKGRRGRVDRKSTRLNSSHVAISYAVFCL